MKPYSVFICHKKSSGKDYADHLKAGLEEMGYHTFLDSKDIPKLVDGREEWIEIRNQALKESKTFILIITPGFDLSQEVRNEIKLARQQKDKRFIYFRHRDLARKIIVDLEEEKVDLGRQEQVSFETKEELLRLTHSIFLKNAIEPDTKHKQDTQTKSQSTNNPKTQATATCAACSKVIEGSPHIEVLNGKTYSFDSIDCAKTFRRLKSVYGEAFE